ncbi:capping protein-inhibiting regulator of actin dynamics isoform X2 [Plectropomus leopardus]|uniref:capping protein-inhibiting regulator of actin dynamics isoform X2 n=1 Tax=Plectropomus leopardus TaxID=160734 RepID=UPI001C4D08B6|nr:capping protein-inhibiting regulator of actin dynamics isoform X2 [Plectropomus leopardus]
MESFSGDTEESAEEIPGRKKSRIKSLRTRLFGKSKRTGGEGDAKLSQSASDITAAKGLGSDEDLACSQRMMGSRALSHDSIFLADQVLTEAEPARVLSQENVHSKIKALQMKLQQQNLHLGPPPLVLPIRRPEDVGSRSEDDSLPHSPPEMSGALNKTISQPSSRPLSPNPKPAPTKPGPPLFVSSNSSSSSAAEPPLDFSSPAQFTPCLDTSAARHRMSVKPRNQRASTKRTLAANDSNLQTPNNINHPESVRKEEQRLDAQEEMTLETEQVDAVTPDTSEPSNSQEAASKSSSHTVFQQDQALPEKAASQVLRVKPHRAADSMSSERPHSSFIQTELKDNRDGDFEIQIMSHYDKRNTQNKAEVSSEQLSTPSLHQQVHGETESTRGIKRPSPGSGSFHFSINTAKKRDGERPRSGSFVGVVEQTEARHKTVRGAEDKSFSVGRFRQEGAQQKSSVHPWDRRDSLKKMESLTPSKTDTGTAEVESSQEVVEEAVEAQEVEEDEGKTAFGVKLRSTTLSMRYRSDTSANQNSKPPEEQKRQEIRPTDPAPSGFSLPVKHNPPSTGDIMATEVQTTSSNLKENVVAASQQPQHPAQPQPVPQTASSEVSWMSLAMEKTRSLHQLFSSRFPRDFSGVQAAARPQAQEQTETLPAAQTQTVKTQQSATEPANQPLTDAAKAQTAQSRSQAQTVKPSAVQQRMSPVQSNIFREAQTLKQTSDHQPTSHQTNPWTAQSPLHSSSQTETASQSAQGSVTQSLAQSYLSSGQQQPPWSNRGLHPLNQLKSTTSASTTSSATASPPVSTQGRGEGEAAVQEKEGASQSGRRAVWAGSVSERAAFLEKRAEWNPATGTKGVCGGIEKSSNRGADIR